MIVIWCRQQLARLSRECINAFQDIIWYPLPATTLSGKWDARYQVPWPPFECPTRTTDEFAEMSQESESLHGFLWRIDTKASRVDHTSLALGPCQSSPCFLNQPAALIVLKEGFFYPRCSTGGYNHPTVLGLWKGFHPKVLFEDINTCTICVKPLKIRYWYLREI